MDTPMPEQMPQGDMMGGELPPMDDTQNDVMPPMDDTQQPQGSDFDTNFDAGVEADEDTDPKKFIQQLTGKLSTTLNSYNGENEDEGLNKYVAKMIVKATMKNADEATKKDVIKAINTAQNPEPVNNETDVDDANVDVTVDNTEEVAPEEQPTQEPVQERVLTKKQLMEMAMRHKK